MSKTSERRTVILLGEMITGVNIIEGGTGVEIFSISDSADYQEETNMENVKGTQEYIEKYFPVVKASTLSLEDEFLRHEPESINQSQFKQMLVVAIISGLSDFRAQLIDPSFDENGCICYKAGMKPAVAKSAEWWKKNAEEFMPEKKSRLGLTKERIAFLGLLIKYLIEEQEYTVSNAWKAVCDQSKDLGHYYDSKYAKHVLESTGSRQVGKWYDLANTYKIILDNKEDTGLWIMGGYYYCNGDSSPLTQLKTISYPNNDSRINTGWIVLSV